jgi:adenylosuccinate lyase
MIAPDATTTLGFMIERTTSLVKGLVVREDGLRANLERSGGLFFSEGILLALVETGLARQEAYVLVQRNAMQTLQGAGSFRDLLKNDPDIQKRLDAAKIDRCFDLDHALSHVEGIIDRAIAAHKSAPRPTPYVKTSLRPRRRLASEIIVPLPNFA